MNEIYEGPNTTVEIPEKYNKAVKEIANNINCGSTCFLNPEILTLECLTELDLTAMEDPEEFEAVTGEVWENTSKHESWKNCITIEKPDSHQSFKIMESFAKNTSDNKLKDKLFNALNNRKPFANFNIIHNSKYREEWFNFKQQKIEEWVWSKIEKELTNLT